MLNTVLVFTYSRLVAPDSPGTSHDLDFTVVGWFGWGLALAVVALLVQRGTGDDAGLS